MQNIKKSRKFVKMVNGDIVNIPETIKTRFSSYKYNEENRELRVECFKCHQQFAIYKLSADNDWEDIHSEVEYRYVRSKGYGTYCAECEGQQTKPNQTKVACALVNRRKSYELEPENQKYLAHRAIDEDISITQLLNHIISNERRLQPRGKLIEKRCRSK